MGAYQSFARTIATVTVVTELALSGCAPPRPLVLPRTTVPAPTEETPDSQQRYISLLTCAFAGTDSNSQQSITESATRILGNKGLFPSVLDFFNRYGIDLIFKSISKKWKTIGSHESYRNEKSGNLTVDFDRVENDCIKAHGVNRNPENKNEITIVQVNGPLGGNVAATSSGTGIILVGDASERKGRTMSTYAHEIAHELRLGHVVVETETGEVIKYASSTDVTGQGHWLSEDNPLYEVTNGAMPSRFSIPSLYKLRKTNAPEFANIENMEKEDGSISISLTDLYADTINPGTKRGIILKTSTGEMVSIELRLESENPNSYDYYAVPGTFRNKNNPAVIISKFSSDPNIIDSKIIFNSLNPTSGNWFEPGHWILVSNNKETYMIFIYKTPDGKITVAIEKTA